MKTTTLRIACITALSLALAACQGEKKTARQDAAAGEILPGSTSDAMLPYDTVRSQPPLAPIATGRPTGKASGKATGDVDAEAIPATEAATTPMPTASPSPQASAPAAE
jgi:hypothetical protein